MWSTIWAATAGTFRPSAWLIYLPRKVCRSRRITTKRRRCSSGSATGPLPGLRHAPSSGHRIEQQADEDRREVADCSVVRIDDQRDGEDDEHDREVTPSPRRCDVIGEHSYSAARLGSSLDPVPDPAYRFNVNYETLRIVIGAYGRIRLETQPLRRPAFHHSH